MKSKKYEVYNRVLRSHGVLICEYCRISVFPVTHQTSSQKATIDHVIPLSKGGGNKLKNLKLACNRCNQKKQDYTHEI